MVIRFLALFARCRVIATSRALGKARDVFGLRSAMTPGASNP